MDHDKWESVSWFLWQVAKQHKRQETAGIGIKDEEIILSVLTAEWCCIRGIWSCFLRMGENGEGSKVCIDGHPAVEVNPC